MRLQNIYDSIPDAIDRVVEKVIAKYEWVGVENPYRDSPEVKAAISGLDLLRHQAGLSVLSGGLGLLGYRGSIAAQQSAAVGNNCNCCRPCNSCGNGLFGTTLYAGGWL